MSTFLIVSPHRLASSSRLIVSQNEARIEAWRRTDGGEWEADALFDGEVVDLPELGGGIGVEDVYTGIAF